LAIIQKYKLIVAATLLLLQVFISMPVQLWHHHNGGTSTDGYQRFSASENSLVVTSLPTKVSEAHCQLCAHHFAVYESAPYFTNFVNNHCTTKEFSERVVRISSTPNQILSNRGPPMA